MTFTDFTYTRPNLDDLRQQFEKLTSAFEGADADTQLSLIRTANRLRSDFMTQQSICYIRHTSDTTDEFYNTENDFFNEATPQFEGMVAAFSDLLIGSDHRGRIRETFGSQFLLRTEISRRAFDPDTIDLLTRENQLTSEYQKLKAQAVIEFEGKQYNLSSIQPLLLSPVRERRRRASAARWAFYAHHEDQLARIYNQLVEVRTEIAQKMGHDTYVPLGYDRMSRTDYGAAEVQQFREQVKAHIVPLVTRLYEKQKKRLGLDELYYYDEAVAFPEGNPQPQGTPEDTIEGAADLYAELSPQTRTFFELMRRRGLMDLVARDGKATGGYCTFLYNHNVPFIFSNFNGTSGDIDVLTHELGHAFQMYESRHQPVLEYILPTYEACEIHSMSMEFFAYPWMDNFFGDDAGKYRENHLETAIKYLPYIVAVDEFQHEVYANPKADRMEIWQRLEKVYLPHRTYGDNDFLNRGGFWMRQSHIFQMPFYYIDYALAQICALQFLQRDLHDHRSAWTDYVALCQAGGSRGFLSLVKLAKLTSPFTDGAVRQVAEFAAQTLTPTPAL